MKTLSVDRTQYQLLYVNIEEVPDVPTGCESIYAFPGHLAIQMVKPKEKQGLIYLPQEFAEVCRNDVGMVIAKGSDIPLSIGDLVVVAYGHGKRVSGFYNNNFKAEDLMVFTGCAGGELLDHEYGEINPCVSVPWWESVVMKIEGNDFIPTGRNLTLKIDPVPDGLIQLTKKVHQCDAIVTAIGKDAFRNGQGKLMENVKVGDRVVFDDGALRQIVGTDHIIVPDFAIHIIV